MPLIQSLPNNPRDRNFWKLLAKYRDKIPQETYDYVFYIVSASVIGENPKLFGFDFENPLGHLEQNALKRGSIAHGRPSTAGRRWPELVSSPSSGQSESTAERAARIMLSE